MSALTADPHEIRFMEFDYQRDKHVLSMVIGMAKKDDSGATCTMEIFGHKMPCHYVRAVHGKVAVKHDDLASLFDLIVDIKKTHVSRRQGKTLNLYVAFRVLGNSADGSNAIYACLLAQSE
jgi:hypothetical protein